MARMSRQKCQIQQRVKSLAYIVVSTFFTLSVCLAPGSSEGSEKEVFGDEIELSEGVLSNSSQKRVRDRRDHQTCRPWRSVNTSSDCFSVSHRQRAIVGHRLLPDLLAPLIC